MGAPLLEVISRFEEFAAGPVEAGLDAVTFSPNHRNKYPDSYTVIGLPVCMNIFNQLAGTKIVTCGREKFGVARCL